MKVKRFTSRWLLRIICGPQGKWKMWLSYCYMVVTWLNVAEPGWGNSPPERHCSPATLPSPSDEKSMGTDLSTPLLSHKRAEQVSLSLSLSCVCVCDAKKTPLLRSPLGAQSAHRTGAERSSVLQKLKGTSAAEPRDAPTLSSGRPAPRDPVENRRCSRGGTEDTALLPGIRRRMDLSRW